MFMVNDNVRYAGVSISIDMILSKIAEQIGFTVKNILFLPQGKGNSSQQMDRHGKKELRKMCLCMEKRKMISHLKHLESYQSLITPYTETRAGFIALALEKNKEATPFVESAKVLKAIAKKASKPKDLLGIKDIYGALLTASGISDKAKKYLKDQDKKIAIMGLIENFLDPAGKYFVDELVYRFLTHQRRYTWRYYKKSGWC